jgi:hypothetical protein
MAGLGAYGGAGLAGGLSGLGEQALASRMPEAYAEGLPPAQVAQTLPPASAWDKLSAGAGRLTEKGGLEAFANQMGGTKGLLMAGLPALAGASAFEADKAVPTTTRQPGMIRPHNLVRRRVPEDEARRTGRYFDDRIEAGTPYAAAEGGQVPGFAEGGRWRSVNELTDEYGLGNGALNADAYNDAYRNQFAQSGLANMSQADAINYLQSRIDPSLRPRVYSSGEGEGGGYAYTEPYARLTASFDPLYEGGVYGHYGVDADGKVQFVKDERSGGWFNDNMDWLGPLLVGGAALAGGAGLLGGGGAELLGGADAVAAGGAGGPTGLTAASEGAAQYAAAAEAAGAGSGAAGASAAAPTLSSGLGSLASAALDAAKANPIATGALLAAATGAAGAGGQQQQAASGGADTSIPTSTSPISVAAPSVNVVGGPAAGQQTQSDAAYRYLMGQQAQSRPMAEGGLAALAGGGMPGGLGDYSDGGRLLRGPGDGVSDSIPASINGKRPARLADGEFVIPARIVSELGNGSTEAGARQLYAMMDRIQKRRRKSMGKNAIAKDTKARSALPA